MTEQPLKKRIAIFGSTGSIGTQALEVIRANPSLFEVEILTAQTNDELLITGHGIQAQCCGYRRPCPVRKSKSSAFLYGY
jgi:1-deoxy-D-xylulose 5-phosphate reductoisomerase